MTQWMLDLGMIFITVALLPQIYKTWKNRDSIKDLDFRFLVLTLVGNAFTVSWGSLNSQYGIVMLNAVYLIWILMSMVFVTRARSRKADVQA